MIRGSSLGGWFLALALTSAGAALALPDDRPIPVNDQAIVDGGLVRELSEYGFFVDARAQVPNVDVTPYRLNTPLYSDGAEKLRFLYLPPGSAAAAQGEGLLSLPVGAALIKTFAFGEGKQRRLIETRVLLHRADGWTALPYRWNDAQTEAVLAVAGGRIALTTPQGEEISYRIPNKNQCKECHGLYGEVVPIGPKARNLSRDWLGAMIKAGKLDNIPGHAAQLPLWEARAEASAEAAARAYLDVNCAHCHQPGAAASNSGLDLRWEQHDPLALGIGKRPVAAGRGSGGLLFDIVRGRPEESILVYRMNHLDSGVAMPELGKSTIDLEGVAAVELWIKGL